MTRLPRTTKFRWAAAVLAAVVGSAGLQHHAQSTPPPVQYEAPDELVALKGFSTLEAAFCAFTRQWHCGILSIDGDNLGIDWRGRPPFRRTLLTKDGLRLLVVDHENPLPYSDDPAPLIRKVVRTVRAGFHWERGRFWSCPETQLMVPALMTATVFVCTEPWGSGLVRTVHIEHETSYHIIYVYDLTIDEKIPPDRFAMRPPEAVDFPDISAPPAL